MTVLFQHNSLANRRMVLNLTSIGKSAVFLNGMFETTDKEIVTELLRHSFYKRNVFSLKTDAKLVNDWLENDAEPSYLTKEQVDNFTDTTIIELGKHFETRNQGFPALMRAELIGKPVSDRVNEILKTTGELDDAGEAKTRRSSGRPKKVTEDN